MKGQLEELGEETDENVENLSKMQGQVLNLTKGKVNIFDNAGEFRSTYEIMRDIANVWDELNSTAQADLLETIAGKHRANSVAALLSNWQNVEKAVKSANEAEGSAARENAKYVDSLQGRLDKLTTAWQAFSETFMNSDFLKGGISTLTTFVELIEKLVDTIGTAGTIGLGAGIFGLFKNRTGIMGDLSAFGSIVSEVMSSSGKLSGRFKDVGSAAKMAGGSIVKGLTSSLSGTIGVIGLVAAAIGLAINAYKNYREEISRARQETIQSSDEFLDASGSFEQAYIKYSGRTNLTTEEESELTSAINSTVDALGDKSSALKDVVNGSNDYLASLERIADEEIRAANRAAKDKRDNARLELEDAAMGWARWDGSEVNVSLENSEATRIAKEIGADFFSSSDFMSDGGGSFEISEIRLSNDADVNEIIEYYNLLLDYQEKLSDANLVDTKEYEQTTSVIEKLSNSIKVYTDGVYEAAKAQYQLDNGIPKSTEAYINMRETILNSEDLVNASLDTKNTIANTLDSEYSQLFDLSSVEFQARKFVGIINGYNNDIKDGIDEISTVETFLNMRTAVNNDECTVGEYLAQFDEIDKMSQNWTDEEKELFNTTFNIDTDYIKQQYENASNYLTRLIRKRNNGESVSDYAHYRQSALLDIENFLSNLNAGQLTALMDIRTEINWDASSEEIFKQIEDRVKLNEAFNFTIPIDAEIEWKENFNTILEESASAAGLTSESITSLTNRYKDLEEFDAEGLFMRTAHGIKINTDAVNKLESALEKQNKTQSETHLKTLEDEYARLTKKIENAGDTAERADFYAQRDDVVEQIKEISSLASQYEGLTSAYNDWLNAQEAADKGDTHGQAMSMMEEAEELKKTGYVGTNEFKASAQFLSYDDLSNADVDTIVDKWVKGKKKFDKYFTEDESGSEKFLNDLNSINEGWAKLEDGEWTVDIDIDEAAKEMGVSTSFIMAMLDELEARGIKINYDDDGLDKFKTQAEEAQEAYNKIAGKNGEKKIEFKFGTGNIKTVNSQLDEAKLLYDTIVSKDGKINLDAEGAEEARKIILALIKEKQELEKPAIMDVEVSADTAETDIGKATQAVQNLQNNLWKLEQSTYDPTINSSEVQAEINKIIGTLNTLEQSDPEIYAKLGLDATQTENLKTAISNIQANIKAGVEPNQEDIATVQSTIKGIDATVVANVLTGSTAAITPEATTKDLGNDFFGKGTITPNPSTLDLGNKFIGKATITPKASTFDLGSKFTGSGTINLTPNPTSLSVTVTGQAKGTAHAVGVANVGGTTGRAFARGNWGIKGNGTALGGELGQELVVRDGKFFTIGDNGAEFFQYRKNDIIFNAAQTESLFKYGGIKGAKPRGTMLATGSAFVEGKAFSYTGGGKGKLYKNSVTGEEYGSSDSDTDKFEEVLDWIEVILDRVERSIDKFDQQANNIYKNWSSRNNALLNQISEVNKEIGIQQQAYNKYMSAANGVGLSSSWASKVRNGEIDIDTIKDEALADKIKSYQDYYEKALDCEDAIRELREEESKLYKQRFDNVATQYEGALSIIEHEKNMLEEYISQSEAQAWLVSSKYYDALADNEQKNISKLKEEKNALLSSLETAMNSGTIDKHSEAWYEMVNAVDEVTLAITESETALKEYQQTLQQLDWEVFDILQERISNVTEEADFLIELLSNSKLYEDNGQLTNEGKSTLGLHGQNYNVYMRQADEYAEQIYGNEEKGIIGLNKEIEKDPYDQDLINRRDELLELQRESILAAEDEKEAIRDMVEEGIEYELDALQELIDKKNEELDSVKDLYDYNKKVKEQTKEIASLEKQMAAYSGDDSEEAKAKIQELKVSLEEAKSDLEETEYDKYISDTQKILDDLYLEYETILNERLDNLDGLISDMILEINSDAGIISDTINSSADKVGYTLTNEMTTIWSSANNVITTYGERFSQAQTTTNSALNAINTNLNNMITQLNKKAETKVQSAATSSAANSSQANAKPATTTPAQPAKPANTSAVGKTINAGGAPIYDYAGDTSGERQYFRNDPRYVVLEEKNGYLKVRHHSLSSGVTGWFKKSDVSGYKTGVKDLLDSELAWTQEGRKQEFIVRPSDGAILTPLAKGDSVLNANASNNIWNMANSPAEFIKDNLNLGVANVPNNSNINNNYTQNLENVVFNLPNVQNYSELLSAMQKDKNFEKLILSMSIDRLAGGSSLAKGKSIR